MPVNERNNKKQVSVVVPAYNEEANIGGTLDVLLLIKNSSEADFEIIVVDDASSDRTVEVVKKYDVKLIQHEHNRGYGASLKTGIHYTQYDIIAITDADSTYPINKIPELVNFIGDYDMVVGARKFVHVPLIRRPAKWILNKYANYLVREKIPDLNSGLRVFKKDIYEKFRGILPPGFSFTTTITLAFLSNDYRVKYTPIDYFKRGGRSKIKPIRDTINFFALVTRASLYFHPLRVYAPISFVLLGIGIILFSRDVYMRDITDKTMMFFLWGIQFGILGFLADMISRQKK